MRALIAEVRALRESTVKISAHGETWHVKSSAPKQDVLRLCLEVWALKEKAAGAAMSLGLSLETDRAGDGNDKFYNAAAKYSRLANSFNVKARGWQTSLNMWMEGREPYYDRIKKGFMSTRKQAMDLIKGMQKLVPLALDIGMNDYEARDAAKYLKPLVDSIDEAVRHL